MPRRKPAAQVADVSVPVDDDVADPSTNAPEGVVPVAGSVVTVSVTDHDAPPLDVAVRPVESVPDTPDAAFVKAEATVLDGLRALLGLGRTRAQVADAVNVCFDTLYQERRDAVTTGHADPFPTF